MLARAAGPDDGGMFGAACRPCMFAGLLAFLPAFRIGLPLRLACLGCALSSGIRGLATRHGHAGFGSERGDGGGKVEAVTLADIAYRVAPMRLAPVAMVVPVFINREARRRLGMKWTARDKQPATAFELVGIACDQCGKADTATKFGKEVRQ